MSLWEVSCLKTLKYFAFKCSVLKKKEKKVTGFNEIGDLLAVFSQKLYISSIFLPFGPFPPQKVLLGMCIHFRISSQTT